MTEAEDARHLAETIRAEVDYINENSPGLSWGFRIAQFSDEGKAIAEAIEESLAGVAVSVNAPEMASGVDAYARARVGALLLTAANVGAESNSMTATWAIGAEPPPQAAGFEGVGPTIGYLSIGGAPTVDFEGVVEITSDGGVGVGEYRFSDDGGSSWTTPDTIPASFTHAGVTVTFADEIDIPDVVPEAVGEIPLFANYLTGAVASWSSRGFDTLTLTLGRTVETFSYLRPGATWFIDGAARSTLVGAATWNSESRPVPQSAAFSGGSARTVKPATGNAFASALTDAVARGNAWRRRWNIELSDYVVTRSPSPPPSL